MTAETDWSDPNMWSDWIARLNDRLVKQDLQYVGLKRIERMKLDPDSVANPQLADSDPRANATLTAAATMSVLITALQEIPTFRTGWGVATLRDVAAALADVDAGARPKMFEPRPEQHAPKIGVGRRMLIATVILCVELLKASGQDEMAACGVVAAAFTEVGHRGRKGGPLSAKTVFEWSAKSGDDMRIRVILDDGLGHWRTAYGWPPTHAAVMDLVKSKTLDPFLLAQI